MGTKTAWVLTDDKAGMITQAVGLAEAVGLPFEEKIVRLRPPWAWLPPLLWPGGVLGLAPDSDHLAPPWPDLVISCGRKAIGPAREVKRRSGGRTFQVYIQNPHIPLRAFDLVVAGAHDRISGDNVISIRGALHRVTAARLRAAAQEFAPALADLPRPLTAVLVGGPNGVYHMTPDITARFADQLAAFASQNGGSLAITPSRRTGGANETVLRERLSGPRTVIWDGTGANPYFGYLALADHIIVTCDSVSMVSEACATGKPVHVFDLPGGNAKFKRFHTLLRDEGVTRPFTGNPAHWTYPPFDDTARIGAKIRQRMGLPA
jgi:mitochondrial fission protein ELM1